MTLLTIALIELRRLKNAEHVQLHTNIRNIINSAGTSKIGLAQPVFTPYQQAITSEQDIVYKAAGSAITAEMEKADLERDNVFRRIRRKLEVCKYENAQSEAFKAAEVIEKHLVGQYTGAVPNLPMQEETAVLTGFVQDCRNLLSGDQVEAIGIDGDLDDLEDANSRFNQLYQERVAEKADVDGVTALQLRAITDSAYGTLSVALNAIANDPDSAKAEQTAAARAALASINVVINEAKTRLNQRLSGTSGTISEVIFPDQREMPVLLNDIDHFQIGGTKLTENEIKLTLIEQVNGKPGTLVTKSLDKFSADYGADYERLTDPDTGYMTVNVSDWRIGSDRHVTVTEVRC